MGSIRVFAPATVANVGSAFDVLGCALEAPGDIVEATLAGPPGVRVLSVTGDQGKLQADAGSNTAAVAAQALLLHLQEGDSGLTSVGVELSIEKGLPIGSGLGSSSASAVAGVVALNELLGAPVARADLIPFAMEGERAACGAAHADNVAPSLLGGFVLIRSYSPLECIALPAPEAAWVSVVSPHLELRTEDARKILKRTVSLEAAIAQWGNVAALVAGICQKDIPLMGRALEDKIVEPERAQLIPGFYAVKQAALQSGAAGCSISGSGPSVFALSESEAIARASGDAMARAFGELSVSASIHVSRINKHGAVVLSRS